jgi:hypothetical protein
MQYNSRQETRAIIRRDMVRLFSEFSSICIIFGGCPSPHPVFEKYPEAQGDDRQKDINSLHATISGIEIQGARPTGKIHISNAN